MPGCSTRYIPSPFPFQLLQEQRLIVLLFVGLLLPSNAGNRVGAWFPAFEFAIAYRAVKRTAAVLPLGSVTTKRWCPGEGTAFILCWPWEVEPR